MLLKVKWFIWMALMRVSFLYEKIPTQCAGIQCKPIIFEGAPS